MSLVIGIVLLLAALVVLNVYGANLFFNWIPKILGKQFLLVKKNLRKNNDLPIAEKQPIDNSLAFTLEFITNKGGNDCVSVINPFRGVLVVGGAGSGKSLNFAAPIIYQSVQKGFAGIIYDYKYPELSSIAMQAATEGEVHSSSAATKLHPAKQFRIHFEDPATSHRVNPLHPRYILTTSYAEEFATVIINNLLPETIQKKDFWLRSAVALFQATIWYFKEEHPAYCDLPHMVTFLQSDTDRMLNTLRTNETCARLISSLLTALDKRASSQLSAVVSTLQIALNKINFPEAAYILSGDDVDLDLNNPAAPKLLLIGSSAQMKEAFSPLISLICTVALKKMNAPDKCPSLLLLDEAATLYIPHLEDVPATGRSRKIAVVYLTQDFSQMYDKYGKEKTDALIANLLNQFYGKVGHLETANYISRLFGKREVVYATASHASTDNGSSTTSQTISYNLKDKDILTSRQVMEFDQGCFATVLAEVESGTSKMKVRRYRPFIRKKDGVNLENEQQDTATVKLDLQHYSQQIIETVNQHILLSPSDFIPKQKVKKSTQTKLRFPK